MKATVTFDCEDQNTPRLESIMATLAELKTALEDLKATVAAEAAQAAEKLTALEAAIQQGSDTTELLSMVADIKGQVSGIIPDEPPPAPEVPAE